MSISTECSEHFMATLQTTPFLFHVVRQIPGLCGINIMLLNRKKKKCIRKKSLWSHQELNQGPPVCKASVILTRPWRLIFPRGLIEGIVTTEVLLSQNGREKGQDWRNKSYLFREKFHPKWESNSWFSAYKVDVPPSKLTRLTQVTYLLKAGFTKSKLRSI